MVIPDTLKLSEMGRSKVNGFTMRLVFPHMLVTRVHKLADTLGKSLNYNFIGSYTPEREWVHRFDSKEHANRTSIVRPSFKRYNPRTFFFDYEYFNVLATSRFTLCPVGEDGWSYRFLEAMALSIPVLSTTDPLDIHAIVEGYFYYVYTPPSHDGSDDQYQQAHIEQIRTFVYLREQADANYQRLLDNHVIGDKLTAVNKASTKCEFV